MTEVELDTDRFEISNSLRLLEEWYQYAEKYWYDLPEEKKWGCFGSGYNHWGVQTNQKYLAAMAVLADRGHENALERCLAALRFSLASHKSGPGTCTDGTRWGHTWISALGIERMMFGVHLLEPHFTDQDHEDLRRMLTSEAQWLWHHYVRNNIRGVVAGKWEHSGHNQPESNIWNGALLWRTAAMYPDDPRGEAWKELAHCFLVNGVSLPQDADDETLLAGLPIRERLVGANFFPNLALDHRGFMNLGYMVICTSNAAMLHFDLKQKEFTAPETMHHHQADLWRVIKGLIFSNGRLARIGGDDRARYTYCHDYLVPTLLYAADHHEDPQALFLLNNFLGIIAHEQEQSGDGSFFGKRLKWLEEQNPYYFTRLESDRACVLAMAAAYSAGMDDSRKQLCRTDEFEASVAGHWWEPEHGSVLHRCSTRLASFAWRSFELSQGLCLPPAEGHLAEWDRNLCGWIEAVHHQYDPGQKSTSKYSHQVFIPQGAPRRLLDFEIRKFEGGFITWGRIMEGVDIEMAEAWTGTDSAVHHLVFAALPDGHTVVGLQYAQSAPRRAYFKRIMGLHLNLPNDLFNGYRRILHTAGGELPVESPAPRDEVLDLKSRWANIDGRLAVVGLYGADSLVLCRTAEPRGGVLKSLFVEELAWKYQGQVFAAEPESILLDAGWMVGASLDEKRTEQWAAENRAAEIKVGPRDLRAVRVSACDGREYMVAANFGFQKCELSLPEGVDLCRPEGGPESAMALEPGGARIIRLT